MSTKCIFRFENNPEGVYYSGQLLSGNVELTITKPKTIRAIYITIIGCAQVQWTQKSSRKNTAGKNESFIQPYTSNDEYLSYKLYVAGRDGGDSIELNPGQYSYNFQVQLPNNTPSSYTGVYGQIRYDVTLTINRPLRYDNIFKRPFTVISPTDLNQNPNYKTPINEEEEKKFLFNGCCCFAKKDPILFKVKIPQSGYTAGQNIQFNIFVDNLSTIDCRGVKIKLEQGVQFICHKPEMKNRWITTKITEKFLGPVIKLSRKEFNDVLEIPAIPPSSLEKCNIIKISYVAKIIGNIAGLHRNVSISIPIVIGTIPIFHNSQTQVISPQSVSYLPSIVNNTQDGLPNYAEMVPPSYEEAMKTGEIFVDTSNNEKPFIPKYPVYHNINPPMGNNQGTNVQIGMNTSPYIPNPTTVPIMPSPNPNQQTKEGTTYGWKA